MSAADSGGERPDPRQPRRPPPGAVPAARRNADRRRRRAARNADRREERRRKELERRKVEREQQARGESRPQPSRSPEPEIVAPPMARASRSEPPDLPGMESLRSARRGEPVEQDYGRPVAEPRSAGQPGRSSGGPRAAAPRPPRSTGSAAGRRRTVVRRVDPWSVFRLSLVLYFCLLVVVTLGLVIFWLVLSRMGPMRSMLESIEQLGIPIDPGLVLTVLVPVGILNVVVWSAANLFFCVLYNLVADLVGGLRVTLSDDER